MSTSENITLLLSPRQTDDSRLLWKAAIAKGWRTERLHNWDIPEVSVGNFAFYGESILASHISKVLGVRFVEPQLDWLGSVPSEYLSRKIQVMTLGEARLLDCRAFYKPADEKSFKAAVYERGSSIDASQLHPESIKVIVSDPVSFELEYRFFVHNRCVKAWSLYCQKGELVDYCGDYEYESDPNSGSALEFTESVLRDNRVYFPRAVVLDVGRLIDGRWVVIECNPAWGSGIYGCNPDRVLDVITNCIVSNSDSTMDGAIEFVNRENATG